MKKRKWIKKIIAIIMAFVMTVTLGNGGLISKKVKADSDDYELYDPFKEGGVTTWDCIYFGKYWQEDTNGDGVADRKDDKQPIKWRVLEFDGKDAFLLSDKILDAKKYNESMKNENEIAWDNSTVRSWLNGYGSSENSDGIDYCDNNFVDSAFSLDEKKSIYQTKKLNASNPFYDVDGGKNTSDKVFLLDIAEASNPSYGFDKFENTSETRVARVTSYVNDLKCLFSHGKDWTWQSVEKGDWWLRSLGYLQAISSEIWSDGTGDFGSRTFCKNLGIRPALHIDLSKTDLWSYAGTVDSKGKTTSGERIGEFEDGGNASLGEECQIPIDEKVGKVFPENWFLKVAHIPVNISKTVDRLNTGAYTVRGTIGVKVSDLFKKEKYWEKYKKDIEEAKKNIDNVNLMEQYREMWGAETLTVGEPRDFDKDPINKKPSISVEGYIENKYDKYGICISRSGCIIATAKWNESITKQFVTDVGPIYLSLSGEGTVKGTLMGVYDYANKKLNFLDNSNLVITPSIAVEGGYGINKAATVGARGSYTMPITLLPPFKVEGTVETSIHIYVLFVMDYNYTIASCSGTLYPFPSRTSAAALTNKYKSSFSNDDVQISKGKLSEMDTSFSTAEGAWYPERQKIQKKKRLSKEAEENEQNMITVLQDGVLPAALPKQVQIGNKKVLIFQAYDKNRTTLNSTVLKYSVFENGEWSEPRAIADDGKADLFADMKVVDGKLVLAWQKEKAEITGDLEKDNEAVLKSLAQNSEIYYAEFDPKTNEFTKPVQVTDNVSYDTMPRICENSSDIIISWVRNDADSLMQQEGTNKIYTSKWNGSSFDEEQELTQASGTIDDYIVFQKEEDAISAVYVGDSNNRQSVFNEDGKVITSLSDAMRTTGESGISGLHYADGSIGLISDGTLYEYDITGNEVQVFGAGEKDFGSNVQYCTNGSKCGYLWSEYDEDSDTGKLVASMKTEDGYSEPVTICEQKGIVWRQYSSILDQDGEWQIITNAQNIATDIHSIQEITKKQKTQLDLEMVYINEGDVEDGQTAINYCVTNTQDMPLDQIEIAVELEDGTVIEKSVSVSLQPGESLVDTVYLDLGELTSAQNVKISIYGDGQKDRTNSTVTDQIGLSDVKLQAVGEQMEDQIKITATVRNLSRVAADTTIALYGNEDQSDLLQKKEGVSLASKEAQEIVFTVQKTDIEYNENGAAYLTLQAETKDGDYNEDNNTAYVILYQEDLVPSASASPSTDPSETPDGTLSPVPTKAPTAKPTGKPSSTPKVKPTKAPDTNASAVPDSPMPAPSDAQASSSQSPAGTQQPSGSSIPVSTLRPGSTGSPTPSATVRPGITAAASSSLKTTVSASKAPAATQTFYKGQVFKDVKTKAYYKILSVTATGGKAAYLRPVDKKVKKVTIKETVTFKGKRFKITQIGNKAFKDYKKLQKITIGRKVSVIGKKTFANCRSLKVVILTGPKQKLPKNAFAGCPRKPKVRKTH